MYYNSICGNELNGSGPVTAAVPDHITQFISYKEVVCHENF